MSTQFTLIKQQLASDSAQVYLGPHNNHNWKVIAEAPPAYEVNLGDRQLQVRQGFGDQSTIVLLKGTFHGITKSSAVIEGYNGQASAKRRSKLKVVWSFVDFSGNEFSWHMSKWGFSWELRDVNDRKVAEFATKKKSNHLMGVMTVYDDSLPESSLMLALLTCTLIYNSMFACNMPVVAPVVVT
ncbi:hypothetical protein LPJ56_000070 [Coemansia sp. RSA 2599]|nr:hypothetical protein LPJ56_000070 [Coemansia sp. RSA 2599]